MDILITQLTWWQASLLLTYTLYTLFRAFCIFNDGLKYSLLGCSDVIKLYHVLWFIIDIPAIILGKLYPLLKFVFCIPIFPLRKDK
jgi:hypothetical protein